MKHLLLVFIIVSLKLTLPSIVFGQSNSPEKTYRLFASGDTIFSRHVYRLYKKNGPSYAFEEFKKIITGSDIALTNLECVVTTKGHFFDKGEFRPFLYRARPELLDMLIDVGFDLVITGNNHAMDYGPEAVMEQQEILKTVGIAHVGTGKNWEEASKPTYIKVDNTIIAFIAMEDYWSKTRAQTDRPGVFHVKQKNMIRTLKRIVPETKRYADLIVFSPHWGLNWADAPTKSMIDIAHGFIDMGGDAIIGHSSHLLHGIEIYKGKPIVYDMGTFFKDYPAPRRSPATAGFVLEFVRSGFTGLRVYPGRLHPGKTRLARGSFRETVANHIKETSRALNKNVSFMDDSEDGALVLKFQPETPALQRSDMPERFHLSNSTTPLPDNIRHRKTNVVLDEVPQWCKDFSPIVLKNGVTVLGALSSEAVRPGRGFVAEVALRAPGKLHPNWESYIIGKRRDGGDKFEWYHPIADASWNPSLWEEGQIVIDRDFVRPQKGRKVGVYDLYWGMNEMPGRRPVELKDPSQGVEGFPGMIHIGEIQIMDKGIPLSAAGVAWDGRLPIDDSKQNGSKTLTDINLTLLWSAAGIGFLCILLFFFAFLRRRRHRK